MTPAIAMPDVRYTVHTPGSCPTMPYIEPWKLAENTVRREIYPQ